MDINEEIINQLNELKDEEYKEFHKKLCNTKYEILGVRLPLLRDIAKKLSKDNWREFILNSKDNFYEEVMIQALVIGYAKIEIEEVLKYLDIIIPKIDNWAICDSMCNNLKITNKFKEQMWTYITKEIETKEEYSVRFGYVMMLNYFIEEKYINEIFKIIDRNKEEKYYIQMAIAWLLSCIYIKFPNETISYLENSKLDVFTYNKSLQKINESYRVNKEEKDKIKKMKKIKKV